jgi:hypothetical protein
VTCDTCGATIPGKVMTRSTTAMESYWDCKRQMKVKKWVIAHRYGKARHYCQPCADGVPVNVEKGDHVQPITKDS